MQEEEVEDEGRRGARFIVVRRNESTFLEEQAFVIMTVMFFWSKADLVQVFPLVT